MKYVNSFSMLSLLGTAIDIDAHDFNLNTYFNDFEEQNNILYVELLDMIVNTKLKAIVQPQRNLQLYNLPVILPSMDHMIT